MNKLIFLVAIIVFINSQAISAQINSIAYIDKLPDAINIEQVKTDTITSSERKNKIAILPFRIIIDKIVASDEDAVKGQNGARELLKDHTGTLELQDVNITNSKLFKAGITQANFKGYTSKEFCEILGVEFVVQVLAEITSINVSNSNSSSTSGGNTRTTFTKSYDAKSQVSIINDQGETVFDETRKPFFVLKEVESYFASVAYLLKRSPIYK
jgi:hypothetical protein